MSGFASTTMQQGHRGTVRGDILVTPSHQGIDDREEIFSLSGKSVFHPLPPWRNWVFLHHTKSKKIFKSIGEDVLCYPKTAFDLRETTLSVDEFADDQQSPPLAHHFQRACNRTILTRIVFLQH